MKLNKEPIFNAKLAEIVGIMLGDGCLYLDRLKKYQTAICLHKEEENYMRYVKKSMEKYFKYKFCITKIKNAYLLRNTSVFVGNQLIKSGLKEGNKVVNKIIIPSWIFKKKIFLTSVIRGIFDTGGCIYQKYDNFAQIQFKFACFELINSLHKAIRLLGYNPTKIHIDPDKRGFLKWKFYLSRQKEINLFFERIRPKNTKHLKRYYKLKCGDAAIRTRICRCLHQSDAP